MAGGRRSRRTLFVATCCLASGRAETDRGARGRTDDGGEGGRELAGMGGQVVFGCELCHKFESRRQDAGRAQ